MLDQCAACTHTVCDVPVYFSLYVPPGVVAMLSHTVCDVPVYLSLYVAPDAANAFLLKTVLRSQFSALHKLMGIYMEH